MTAGLLVGLAALDPRTTRRAPVAPASAAVVDRGPRTACPGRLDGRHTEFARGLAGLAAWYLAECEQETQP